MQQEPAPDTISEQDKDISARIIVADNVTNSTLEKVEQIAVEESAKAAVQNSQCPTDNQQTDKQQEFDPSHATSLNTQVVQQEDSKEDVQQSTQAVNESHTPVDDNNNKAQKVTTDKSPQSLSPQRKSQTPTAENKNANLAKENAANSSTAQQQAQSAANDENASSPAAQIAQLIKGEGPLASIVQQSATIPMVTAPPKALKGENIFKRGGENIPDEWFDAHEQQTGYNISESFIVGICGGTSAGKTLVSDMFAHRFRQYGLKVGVLKEWDFYKEVKTPVTKPGQQYNYDQPEAIDWVRMETVIRSLKKKQTVEHKIYDMDKETFSDKNMTQEKGDIIILDGTMIFHEEKIRNLLNLKIYLDTDDDVRLSRRVYKQTEMKKKDLRRVIETYQKYSKPGFELYTLPNKKYADVIIPNFGGGYSTNFYAQNFETAGFSSIENQVLNLIMTSIRQERQKMNAYKKQASTNQLSKPQSEALNTSGSEEKNQQIQQQEAPKVIKEEEKKQEQ